MGMVRSLRPPPHIWRKTLLTLAVIRTVPGGSPILSPVVRSVDRVPRGTAYPASRIAARNGDDGVRSALAHAAPCPQQLSA